MHVVIAGQPNVGKSSLLNALAGEELAIVTPIAGTTRDVVRQSIQIDGVPMHVIDTAGLRGEHEGQADTVEAIGMARAWSHIERADAVLFLHDLSRQHEPEHRAHDARIAEELATRVPRGTPVVHVWNKADVAHAARPAPTDGNGETHLLLSAKTGQGLAELRHALLRLVGWEKQTEGLFIARARHVQALAQVHDHLALATAHVQPDAVMLDLMAEELRLAQQALSTITGEFTPDDLLGSIFSTFCIGK
jgi:tRNA modification GTPase